MINVKTARDVYQMQFALCDDNHAFLNILGEAISRHCAYKDWSCSISRFSSPEKLLQADLESIQVVFLDIDMPQINGLDVAKQLHRDYPELIIVFVTAFLKYAPAGYWVNAFRYLLKNQLEEELPLCLDSIWEKLFVYQDSIPIRQPEQTVHMRLLDIVYFEGTPLRRVLLHTTQQKQPQACIGKLGDYETQLTQRGFLRIQKSYLVNMLHIVKIKSYKATLDTGEVLTVSEQNYSQICQKFTLWKGQSL